MAKRSRKASAKPRQVKSDSRKITITEPFDYYWSHRSITHFHTPGDYRVKNVVADFAIEKGYAREGDETADAGTVPPVDNQDPADADRSAGRPTVDPDAE